jgi:hypothetical protein
MDSGEDEVAKFNRAPSDANVVLKLGLYAGSCIAVTAGGVLDYFGSTANTTAARSSFPTRCWPTIRRARRSMAVPRCAV